MAKAMYIYSTSYMVNAKSKSEELTAMKKICKKLLAISMIVGSLTLTPELYFDKLPSYAVAHAEVKTYEGVGEYLMSDGETQEIAKMGARLHAIRNAQEKAGVFISSRTAVVNGKLTEDEIMAFTAGLVSVEEVTYKPMPLNDKGGYIKFIANVTVTIDTDDLHNRINYWINLSSQEKSNLIEKNKNVQKIINDQSTQIAELENLIKNSNDTKKINEIIKTLDKETLKAQYMEYNQRASSLINRGKDYFERANKNRNGNYYNRGANYFLESIDESTAAIQLMPDKIDAYDMRAYAYFQVEDYPSALKDLDKCIQFNPQDSNYYDLRGACYFNLGDFNHAIEDYTKGIQFTTNKELKSFLHVKMGGAHFELYKKYRYPPIEDSKSADSERELIIKEYEKAIEADPKNYEACRELGTFFNGYWKGYDYMYDPIQYDKVAEYCFKELADGFEESADRFAYAANQAANHEIEPEKEKPYRAKSEELRKKANEYRAKEKEYKAKSEEYKKKEAK